MLTNEDKETLRYPKQSSDALKRDAVRLIESLSDKADFHEQFIIDMNRAAEKNGFNGILDAACRDFNKPVAKKSYFLFWPLGSK